MYKLLLEKGFEPIYYTNDDWFESRDCESRLFYRYTIKSKELLNSVLNTLDIFDDYFGSIESKDVVVEITVDEFLKEYWICFYNIEVDNYIIPNEKISILFNTLPNKFTFECE